MSGARVQSVLVYSAQMEAIGGIESHVREFCLRLAAAGRQVTLLSSRSSMDAVTRESLMSAGVALVLNEAPWLTTSPLRKWVWTLAALARLSLRRFDVVYTNGQGKNPATVQRWFRGRTRVVHHHHTSIDATDIQTWPAAYREAMRKADVLVVCADFIRHRMQTAIGRKDVDVAYCFSRKMPATARTPAPQSPVVFGYFGRLIEGKGIDWIQRLSQEPRLGGIRWKIWGNEGHYRASDFAGFDRIDYEGGFAGQEGLRAALDALDCFTLFSTWLEGLPVSLMEVMGAGKPWLATPEGGIPELAHDPASCVLVRLDDYENVVAVCLAMEARIRAGQIDHAAQRAFYESRLGERALLEKWLALFEGRA
ncbi:MAG: glycosyltransferase family 4 protein [Gammaproteobacteria bacterium]